MLVPDEAAGTVATDEPVVQRGLHDGHLDAAAEVAGQVEHDDDEHGDQRAADDERQPEDEGDEQPLKAENGERGIAAQLLDEGVDAAGRAGHEGPEPEQQAQAQPEEQHPPKEPQREVEHAPRVDADDGLLHPACAGGWLSLAGCSDLTEAVRPRRGRRGRRGRRRWAEAGAVLGLVEVVYLGHSASLCAARARRGRISAPPSGRRASRRVCTVVEAVDVTVGRRRGGEHVALGVGELNLLRGLEARPRGVGPGQVEGNPR